MHGNKSQHNRVVDICHFPPDGLNNLLLHSNAAVLRCSLLSVPLLSVSSFYTITSSVMNLFFNAWENGHVGWECVKSVKCMNLTVSAVWQPCLVHVKPQFTCTTKYKSINYSKRDCMKMCSPASQSTFHFAFHLDQFKTLLLQVDVARTSSFLA